MFKENLSWKEILYCLVFTSVSIHLNPIRSLQKSKSAALTAVIISSLSAHPSAGRCLRNTTWNGQSIWQKIIFIFCFFTPFSGHLPEKKIIWSMRPLPK